MLLEGGVSADSVLDSRPAILLAVQQAQLPILKALLKHKADVASTDEQGWTALHAAAAAAAPVSAAMVEDLIAAGADSQARTKAGMTPLLLALESNHKAAIELLLRGVPLMIVAQVQIGN